MKLEPGDRNGFKPFKIVIEEQEEAEHLLYRLCMFPCENDPKGIEARMRNLIKAEILSQGTNIEGYTHREADLSSEYKRK